MFLASPQAGLPEPIWAREDWRLGSWRIPFLKGPAPLDDLPQCKLQLGGEGSQSEGKAFMKKFWDERE